MIASYDDALKKNGYPAACEALKSILGSRRNRDPFPTIAEIQELITPVPLALDQAKDAAARIIAAVSKYGRYNLESAKVFIGELGWKAVERTGGWSNLCAQLTAENTSIYMAQYRELTAALYRKSQMGLLDYAPALPEARKVFAGNMKALSSSLVEKMKI